MVQVSKGNFTRNSFIYSYTEFTQPEPIQLARENVSTDKDGFIEHINPKFKKEDALENELSHFVNCVISNEVPLVSIDDGIHALKVAIEIEELINEGFK